MSDSTYKPQRTWSSAWSPSARTVMRRCIELAEMQMSDAQHLSTTEEEKAEAVRVATATQTSLLSGMWTLMGADEVFAWDNTDTNLSFSGTMPGPMSFGLVARTLADTSIEWTSHS